MDAKDCWQKLSSLLEMARDEVFITGQYSNSSGALLYIIACVKVLKI